MLVGVMRCSEWYGSTFTSSPLGNSLNPLPSKWKSKLMRMQMINNNNKTIFRFFNVDEIMVEAILQRSKSPEKFSEALLKSRMNSTKMTIFFFKMKTKLTRTPYEFIFRVACSLFTIWSIVCNWFLYFETWNRRKRIHYGVIVSFSFRVNSVAPMCLLVFNIFFFFLSSCNIERKLICKCEAKWVHE